MNREKRKQILQLKPFLDKLETRRLMSLGGAKARIDHEMVQATAALRLSSPPATWGRSRLDLVQHPGERGRPWAGRLSRHSPECWLRRPARLGGELGQRADGSSQVRGRAPPDGGAERSGASVHEPREATDAKGHHDNHLGTADDRRENHAGLAKRLRGYTRPDLAAKA